MGFGQTIGDQRFLAILQSTLPKIAAGLDRLAAAVENHNVLAEHEPVTEHSVSITASVVPPSFAVSGEIPGEKAARAAADGQHG